MGKMKDYLQKQEEVKQALEQLEYEAHQMSKKMSVAQYVGATTPASGPEYASAVRDTPRPTHRSRIKERLQEVKDQAERLQATLDELDTMQFSEGDIVFHKDYGSCIIDGITTKSENSYTIGRRDMEGRGYKLLGRGLDYDGVWVDEDSVVPYNDSTRILYGQKDGK